LAFNEKSASRVDRPGAAKPKVGGLNRHPVAFGIGQAGGGIDLKMPEHGVVAIPGQSRSNRQLFRSMTLTHAPSQDRIATGGNPNAWLETVHGRIHAN